MKDSYFEVGKYYRWTTGRMLHIIGELPTTAYGLSLIAEDQEGRISSLGRTIHSSNWEESTEADWLSSFPN